MESKMKFPHSEKAQFREKHEAEIPQVPWRFYPLIHREKFQTYVRNYPECKGLLPSWKRRKLSAYRYFHNRVPDTGVLSKLFSYLIWIKNLIFRFVPKLDYSSGKYFLRNPKLVSMVNENQYKSFFQ